MYANKDAINQVMVLPLALCREPHIKLTTHDECTGAVECSPFRVSGYRHSPKEFGVSVHQLFITVSRVQFELHCNFCHRS